MKKNNSLHFAFFFGLFFLNSIYVDAQSALQIDSPTGIAGIYPVAVSFFSGNFNGESGDLVLADDGMGTASDGCETIDDLTGKIVLIDRGNCTFTQKALNAQVAGAIAVVICNNESGNSFMMPGSTNGQLVIPAMLLDLQSCNTIKTNLTGATGTIIPPFDSETCISSSEVTPGMYSVSNINSGFSGSIIDPAVHARWYHYTAVSSGLVTINSCNQGADTRLIVIPSENCEALSDHLYVDFGPLAAGIDDCDDGSGFIRASNLTFPALEGDAFFIIWDDGQSSDGFDFEISTDALPEVEVTFHVNMNNENIAPGGAFIAGSFNDWMPEAMDDNGDGTFSIIVDLEEFTIHEYKFLNGMDGWEADFTADCAAESGSGNRTIETPQGGGQTILYCFNSCTICPTCDEPEIIYEDDLEDAPIGDYSDDSAFWTVWPGANQGAIVSANFASDSDQSLHFSGDFNNQDALMLLGDKTSGHYGLAWEMYIPDGKEGYFNIQHAEATGNYAFNCYFELPNAYVDIYTQEFPFEFPHDQWFQVVLLIDLHNDLVRFYVDGQFVGGWAFSIGDYAGDGSDPADPDLTLGAVNFFTFEDSDYDFYIDNVAFGVIPKAGEGQYCHTALPVDPGIHTVMDFSCFGGLDFEHGAPSAAWFTYTPDTDGWISVSSCNGGADTRVWFLSGDCSEFQIHGLSDDICADGGGNAFASYKEAIVNEGKTYFIMWDNIWEDQGFDFELTFAPTPPVGGNFCQTATPISFGTHTIDAYTGNASVAGPNLEPLNDYSGNVQSEWFSFTPDQDTIVNLYTCDLTLEDTRIWVYTGSCDSFESLELLTTVDDNCDMQSGIYDWQVTAGTTYFIEFDNLGFQGIGAHDFVLEIAGVPTIEVTFTVEMDIFLELGGTISPEGMHITGDFINWAIEPMIDNGDETWSAIYNFQPDIALEYRFVLGDDASDGFEGMPGSNLVDCGVSDGVGGYNRFEGVITTNSELKNCYDHCVTCDLVNDHESEFEAAIDIAPNPASNQSVISYHFPKALNFDIQLINHLGQLIFEEKIEKAKNGNYHIDLSQIPAGLYVIVFENEHHVFGKKLVVEK